MPVCCVLYVPELSPTPRTSPCLGCPCARCCTFLNLAPSFPLLGALITPICQLQCSALGSPQAPTREPRARRWLCVMPCTGAGGWQCISLCAWDSAPAACAPRGYALSTLALCVPSFGGRGCNPCLQIPSLPAHTWQRVQLGTWPLPVLSGQGWAGNCPLTQHISEGCRDLPRDT